MSSLQVCVHHCSLCAKVLTYTDSVSIAKLLRSATAIYELVLPMLPSVISERSGGLGCLAAAHFREMYWEYREYVRQHELSLEAHGGEDPKTWKWIPTHELLLSSPGIEVAARPWLYPELHVAVAKVGFAGRL